MVTTCHHLRRPQPAVAAETGELSEIEAIRKANKLPDDRTGERAYREATYADEGWARPLFDIWNTERNANWGHPEVAQVLLAAGADPNALDGAGYTPLAWARERDHDHKHEVPGATVAVLELVSALAGTSQ